jgi:hypothetical protein
VACRSSRTSRSRALMCSAMSSGMPGALAGVDLGLLDPFMQGLRHAADPRLRGDRPSPKSTRWPPSARHVRVHCRAPAGGRARGVRGNRRSAQRTLVRSLAHDGSTFSGVEPSGKSSAVHVGAIAHCEPCVSVMQVVGRTDADILHLLIGVA